MEDQIRDLHMKTEHLLQSIQKFVNSHSDTNGYSGITKFISKVAAELKFYSRLLSNPSSIKQTHINCSNYVYLKAVYDLMVLENTTDVYYAVPSLDPLRIDVVANHGQRWIKVKAGNHNRNAIEYDTASSEEESEVESDDEIALQSPELPIIRQAKEIMAAAQVNKFHYKAPDVVFKFLSPITPKLENDLLSLGVKVEQGLTKVHTHQEYDYLTNVLNIDITTLLSMVSDITHRFDQITDTAFDSKPLKLQYQSEKVNPMLPIFQSIFKDRILVCTMTAFEKFRDIVDIIGGPVEQARSKSLFSGTIEEKLDSKFEIIMPQPMINSTVEAIPLEWRVYVIKGYPSAHFKELDIAKFSDFNIDVFGTADTMEISTITANIGIKRALEKCGKKYAIFVHESRGLIEQKWIKYRAINNI